MAIKQRAVLVTTLHRGVFFGYATEKDLAGVPKTKSLKVKRCRNCIRWASSNKGFLGLATNGPDSNARVGPHVEELLILDVTSVGSCSDAAAQAWEAAPWSK